MYDPCDKLFVSKIKRFCPSLACIWWEEITFPVISINISIYGQDLCCPHHVPREVPHQAGGAVHEDLVVACGDPCYGPHQTGVQKDPQLEGDGQSHSQSAPVPCDLHGAVYTDGALERVRHLPVQGGGLVNGGRRYLLMIGLQLKHLEIQASIFYLKIKKHWL